MLKPPKPPPPPAASVPIVDLRDAGPSPRRHRRLALRVVLFPLTLIVWILEMLGRAAFFLCGMAVFAMWFLLYFVLCLFVPLLGMMMPAIVLCIPFTVIVWLDPKAAPLPFWVFPLGAIGCLLFIGGYVAFLEWLRPPGAPDPFDMHSNRRRYRDRDD